MKLLSQGAEARVYETDLLGEKVILKERFEKLYRHPDLEKRLSKSRLHQEVRCINRAAKAGIHTPLILLVQVQKLRIFMEYVEGYTLKETFFREEKNENKALSERVAMELGRTICRLHRSNITHGDLTTSNAMLRSPDGQIVLIDFGLARPSKEAEDKAVDLYVLERAFTSTHATSPTLFSHVLKAYEQEGSEDPSVHAVLTRFDKVRKRGRKRMAIG
mmetsp:Transcript_426/g.501  ORF Transcript_426/g.501 Transcript_426/m.501 type:complete len:218 (+) Transcript_426:289-942(+)